MFQKAPAISKPLAIPDPSQPSAFSRFVSRLPWVMFWGLAGQGVLSITRFFSKLIVGGAFYADGLTGMGSKAEFGYYDAAFGALMLVVGLHEAFLTTPLTFFHHQAKEIDDRKFAGKMLVISILFSVFAFVCLSTVAGYRYTIGQGNLGLTTAMLAVSVLLPFQLVKEFSRRWLLADIQVKQSALLEFFFASLFVVFLLGLVWTQQVSAASVFLFTALANLVCLTVWWLIFRRSFTLGFSGVGQQAVENLSYGKWVACENLCSVLMVYFSQWFLLANLGANGAGVYSACMTIVLLANPFMLGVASIFGPRAAQEFNRGGWPALLKIFALYTWFVCAVLVPFCIVLCFYGGQLTTLAFNDEYQAYFNEHLGGVNNITFMMSIAIPFFSVSYLLTCCLLAADRAIYSFYAAGVGLAVNIASNLSFAAPTLTTATISFVAGAIGTSLARGVLVWMAYRQRTTRSEVSD